MAIEKTFTSAIDNFSIAVAYSMLELRDSLKSSIIAREIQTLKIVSTSSFSMFSDFLGEANRFLFDKIVVDDKRKVQGTIPTIRTIPESQFSNNVFENEFLNITDENLILAIQKNLSFFK